MTKKTPAALELARWIEDGTTTGSCGFVKILSAPKNSERRFIPVNVELFETHSALCPENPPVICLKVS